MTNKAFPKGQKIRGLFEMMFGNSTNSSFGINTHFMNKLILMLKFTMPKFQQNVAKISIDTKIRIS